MTGPGGSDMPVPALPLPDEDRLPFAPPPEHAELRDAGRSPA